MFYLYLFVFQYWRCHVKLVKIEYQNQVNAENEEEDNTEMC